MVRSLRWRIQIWHGAILAVVIVLFGSITYLQHRHSRMRTIYDELSAAAHVLSGQLQSASADALQGLLQGDFSGASEADFQYSLQSAFKLYSDLRVPQTFSGRFYHHDFELPYFVIWTNDGTQVKASSESVVVPFPHAAVGSALSDQQPLFLQRQGFQEVLMAGPPGTYVLVGRHVGADMADLRNFLITLIVCGLIVFVLGLAGGWFLSARSVQPIAEISRVAADISEKNLDERIDVGETDSEFSNLAETLNDAFRRLQDAFARQLQFTADASHELRTPLSVMQMHQELALSSERTPEEYRAALETCQRATGRMNSLVQSLLTLARLDSDNASSLTANVDVDQLVRDCAEQILPLALAKGIQVRVQSAPVSCVVGNRDQLEQVMINLLTNAVAYSTAETEVTISCSEVDDTAEIAVTDVGPGIPEQDLPHIFERFYRVSPERSRETGGSGLGLSICKTIVEAHGGRITVRSSAGRGSTFTISLPTQDGSRSLTDTTGASD